MNNIQCYYTHEIAFVNWNRIQAPLVYPQPMVEKMSQIQKLGFGGGTGSGSNTQKTER